MKHFINMVLASLFCMLYAVEESPVQTETLPDPQKAADDKARESLEQGKVATTGKPDYVRIGKERGIALIGSEQREATATQTVLQTKVDALYECANIESKDGRIIYYNAIQQELVLADGGTMRKHHSNFVGELKRVAQNVEALGMKKVIELLNAKTDYKSKIANIPAIDTRGGANRGVVGVTSAAKLVTETIQSGKLSADEATKALEKAAAEKAAMLSTAPATPGTTPETKPAEVPAETKPVAGQEVVDEMPPKTVIVPAAPKVGTMVLDQVISGIEKCDEDNLGEILLAVANRLKKSPSPLYQGLGADIVDLVDGINHPIEEVPAQVAHG